MPQIPFPISPERLSKLRGNRKIQRSDSYETNTRTKHIPAYLKNMVARYIYRKVHIDGEDCLVAVCGRRGWGKTNTAGFYAERIDATSTGKTRFPLIAPGVDNPTFNTILPTVCFGMNQLMGFWNDMNTKYLKDGEKATRGKACIVEEAQNIFNSREYHTKKNMMALKSFLTGRTFGNIYFFTYPNFERVDVQIRELFDILILCEKPDQINNRFRHKAFILDHRGKGEYYIRYFRQRKLGRQFKKSSCYLIPPPSRELMQLLKYKGDIWKSAAREGKLSREGNILLTDEEVEKEYPSEHKRRDNWEEHRENEVKKLVEQFCNLANYKAILNKKGDVVRARVHPNHKIFTDFMVHYNTFLSSLRLSSNGIREGENLGVNLPQL